MRRRQYNPKCWLPPPGQGRPHGERSLCANLCQMSTVLGPSDGAMAHRPSRSPALCYGCGLLPTTSSRRRSAAGAMLCTGRFSPGGKTTLMVWRGQLHADSGQTAAAATWRDPSRAVTETLSCVPAPCAASDTPSSSTQHASAATPSNAGSGGSGNTRTVRLMPPSRAERASGSASGTQQPAAARSGMRSSGASSVSVSPPGCQAPPCQSHQPRPPF
mmetsp:Transcript_23518/g.75321  ORF Transcript_23518/g.75321 Transcript_23518/m.75321 type:complete len:217 (-) Transcript_23518:2154-2804(-)